MIVVVLVLVLVMVMVSQVIMLDIGFTTMRQVGRTSPR